MNALIQNAMTDLSIFHCKIMAVTTETELLG